MYKHNSIQESVLKNYWQAKNLDEIFISKISQSLDLSDTLAKLISTRINSLEEAKNFIDPKIKNLLPDPFELLDMHKATDRVITAIKKKENICLLADYDVDGATSAALLKNILKSFNLNSKIYIPQREEGYGPNINIVNHIAKEATLLITLDCGSSSIEELDHANNLGLDTIVLDHHITSSNLPKVFAIVNPNRHDEKTNYKNLAAVGVTFLFLVALISKLKSKNFFTEKNRKIPSLVDQLDIVALGTICDVVKLDPLNRALVKQGLKISSISKNLGYKTLCKLSKIDKEKISSYDLSFLLGPQINAGGRIGNSSIGSRLLSTNSFSEANSLANELYILNQSRKNIESTILEEAIKKAEFQKNDPLILVTGQNWHKGVIGIIAARLKEKYSKLSIVISLEGGFGTASCRSIKQIDISQKILAAKSQKFILKGGGHKMAAGFLIKEDSLTDFHNFLTNAVKQDLKNQEKDIKFFDLNLRINAITENLIEEILQLEPYGISNPAPIFKISNFHILEKKILKNAHISLKLQDSFSTHNKKIINAIAFNVMQTSIAEILLKNHFPSINFSILGQVKSQTWNNKISKQILIQDVILE
ncbi:MAG: single-stranded-DNA-specific exonuclease RecJ [Rickettsia sp.]|nr:single-stranded-DNA-specific exonuclease RecJ [Rickettsia sp.]